MVYTLVMVPFALTGTLGLYVRRVLPQPLQAWGARLHRADAA